VEHYVLVTEPARGTSVRVDVAPGETADEALLRALADWSEAAEFRDRGSEAGCSFSEWLQSEGYQVLPVEEGNRIRI
jgi:hypothetical protein